ncbi:MAG: hypothetical protein K8S24_04660 [Candidatus Aegiribacteria sp.]|nr:hypothetical protein [Candidatus Aegiribacteria sp.]
MLLKLFMSVVLFAGFLPAQEHYFYDSTLIEIFSSISNEHTTILDIASLPVFDDELVHLDNENVDQALESISRFNDILADYQSISQSVEDSGESCMDYDTCEIVSENHVECTYFRDKGDYSITVIQEITPTYYMYDMYCSGVFEGVDYGSMYLLQHQYITKCVTHYVFEYYLPPSPPEFANQQLYSIEYLKDDESMILKSTFYAWDYVVNYHHPFSRSEMLFKDNIVGFTLYAWSYNKEDLYAFWIGTWDFESLSGNWLSVDEDGILQAAGPM